ncbi:sulfatase [Prolixibacteraceae bacterium JC049]|nr:sulfatase [Prolixibacteraceae bacterium JC049]
MWKRFALPLLCMLTLSASASSKKSKPNIIVLLADDLGYNDLSCYGGIPQTPHLDQLASNGIKFTNFYAAAPNCSPSRAGLLTGRSPFRAGIYSYRPVNHPMHLRNQEITIAEELKQAGYQTVHLGKWHLGALPASKDFPHPQPTDQGFDYSYGTENGARPSHHNPVNFVRNGQPLPKQDGYSCQLLANEAISWWKNNYQKEHPFFMYVAFHEPHSKVAAPQNLVNNYSEHKNAATYLACIQNMDLAIGRIIRQLKAMGEYENTLIVFASDNGSYRQASNQPLRALKSWLYEGGIRVPGIISWPNAIATHKTIDEPAGLIDLYSTFCEAAHITPSSKREQDGTNILPLLTGEKFQRQKPLFWFFYRTSPEIAIRQGDFMLMGKDNDQTPRSHGFSSIDMEYIKQLQLQSFELYNLKNDLKQQTNLWDATHQLQKQLLNHLLNEVKTKGVKWDTLPAPHKNRKVKTQWKKYKFVKTNSNE